MHPANRVRIALAQHIGKQHIEQLDSPNVTVTKLMGREKEKDRSTKKHQVAHKIQYLQYTQNIKAGWHKNQQKYMERNKYTRKLQKKGKKHCYYCCCCTHNTKHNVLYT